MSTTLSGPLGHVRGTASLRRLAHREPEWSVLLVTAASWAVLVPMMWRSPMGAMDGAASNDMVAAMQHHLLPDSSMAMNEEVRVAREVVGHTLLAWMIMVLAMMLPTTVPLVRYVAFASRRTRRQRSILAFVLGYLAAWMSLGVPVAVLQSLEPHLPPAAVGLLVALAGVWELTPIKRRALRRCHRTFPVRFSGWPAISSAAKFGWRHGLTCLLIGAPAMVALVAAGHPVAATLVVTVIMFCQKILVRPERWRGTVAASGILAGALMVLG